MSHFIKVVYESVRKDERGFQIPEIKEALVAFGKDDYVQSISYKENMENMIGEILETGFFTMASGETVPIFRIYSFWPHEKEQVNPQPQQPVRHGHEDRKYNKHKRRFHKPSHGDRNQATRVETANATPSTPSTNSAITGAELARGVGADQAKAMGIPLNNDIYPPIPPLPEPPPPRRIRESDDKPLPSV